MTMMYNICTSIRRWRGEMAEVWRLSNVATFRAASNPGFSEKYHVSHLSILGHCFDVVCLDAVHIRQYVR